REALTPDAGRREPGAAAAGSALVLAGFAAHGERFAGITARARRHFARGDWLAGQRGSLRRLGLYRDRLPQGLARAASRLGAPAHDRDAWHAMRDAYAALVIGRPDAELAETFFNSCVRRALHIVGVDPRLEFLGLGEGGRSGGRAHGLPRRPGFDEPD